jgi:NAD(P)-dependent dehydrogenase (short-subunit alcohol dehydrogenase family)
MSDEIRFDGRVAVVTGAGRGVGREYALLLAARGATVVVNDVGAAPDGSGSEDGVAEAVAAEIRELGGRARADTRSVAVQEPAEALIADALADFGRVDILIHNAGFVNGTFEELLAINLKAAYWLTEAVWPSMLAQRYGRILLTTSSAGIFGTSTGSDYSPIQSYGATKMGALGLGKCLAARGRGHNIQVNLVSPHASTRLSEGLPATPRMQWVHEHSRPSLVAPGSVYLVHESCPVSGQIFAVGAGRMARIFIGETVGYVNPELSLEDVAANFDRVCDPDHHHEPQDMDDVTDMYMQIVGS